MAQNRAELQALRVEHRSVYTCRHTFAAWSIRAAVPLYYLSRVMGTSVALIDKTYGHLVPDSEAYLRDLLDGYDERQAADGGTARGRTATDHQFRQRP